MTIWNTTKTTSAVLLGEKEIASAVASAKKVCAKIALDQKLTDEQRAILFGRALDECLGHERLRMLREQEHRDES
jgi:hypothetical protein